MKSISGHIKTIREKPHHVRRRIAFATAGVGAGLLAAVWLVSSISAGVFALKPTSFAQSTEGTPVTVVNENDTSGTDLAGAAAAPATQDANAPAHIDIVSVTPTNSPQAQPTTIPF
jgi:hypothetical protein